MSENTTATEETSQESAVEAKAGLPLDCVFAVKAGMTRFYTEEGESFPVTVLSLEDNTVVTQIKSKSKDGYSAVQLGFLPKKQQRTNKAERGHFQKAQAPGFYCVEEFRLPKDLDGVEVGVNVSPDFLQDGAFVDIRGLTKGKGFQGTVKRWNFAGQPASHGHSVSHRSPGSIGNRADPGRVFPGKKMSGHMGMDNQTTQNLKVVQYDKERRVLLVTGAVPGGKNWVVRILKSKKKGTKAPKK